MTNAQINYQQIYEDILSSDIKDSLELPARFYEISYHQRLMVEELVDLGYQRALQDTLDPDVLADTAELSEEMAVQLQSFSGMLSHYLAQQTTTDEE